MAFVAEDGTGLTDATSLVSVADADTYFETVSESATWSALTTAAKQAALVAATRAVLAHWSTEAWQGYRLSTTQALAFPRGGIVVDGITRDPAPLPPEVIAAVCHVAIKSAAGTSLLPTRLTASETVSGAVARTFVSGGSASTIDPVWAYPESLLRPLTRAGGGGTIRLMWA